MSQLDEAIQSLQPGDLVELFQLDATPLGGPVYYFTSTSFGTDAVLFDGNTYTPIDIQAENFEWNGQGSLPTPVVRISNATRVASAAVIEFNDLLGAIFIRIRTFRQFLDNGDSPDSDSVFPIEVYRVERKAKQNKVLIEWELSSPMDQQGRQIPARQYVRDSCPWIYRYWDASAGEFDYTQATCPYTGTQYFNAQGETVTDPALDRCSKQLTTGCRKRFGTTGELPFGGFPGIGQGF